MEQRKPNGAKELVWHSNMKTGSDQSMVTKDVYQICANLRGTLSQLQISNGGFPTSTSEVEETFGYKCMFVESFDELFEKYTEGDRFMCVPIGCKYDTMKRLSGFDIKFLDLDSWGLNHVARFLQCAGEVNWKNYVLISSDEFTSENGDGEPTRVLTPWDVVQDGFAGKMLIIRHGEGEYSGETFVVVDASNLEPYQMMYMLLGIKHVAIQWDESDVEGMQTWMVMSALARKSFKMVTAPAYALELPKHVVDMKDFLESNVEYLGTEGATLTIMLGGKRRENVTKISPTYTPWSDGLNSLTWWTPNKHHAENRKKVVDNIGTSHPNWLLDLETDKVVYMNKLVDYFCVSHRWDDGNKELDNINSSMEHGESPVTSVNPAYAKYMYAKKCGQLTSVRYCWMDTLCIPQTKEREGEKLNLISKMGTVYGLAKFVVVIDERLSSDKIYHTWDAVFDEMDAFLSINKDRKTNTPDILQVRRLKQLTSVGMERIIRLFNKTQILERGWTFQESYFAKEWLCLTPLGLIDLADMVRVLISYRKLECPVTDVILWDDFEVVVDALGACIDCSRSERPTMNAYEFICLSRNRDVTMSNDKCIAYVSMLSTKQEISYDCNLEELYMRWIRKWEADGDCSWALVGGTRLPDSLVYDMSATKDKYIEPSWWQHDTTDMKHVGLQEYGVVNCIWPSTVAIQPISDKWIRIDDWAMNSMTLSLGLGGSTKLDVPNSGNFCDIYSLIKKGIVNYILDGYRMAKYNCIIIEILVEDRIIHLPAKAVDVIGKGDKVYIAHNNTAFIFNHKKENMLVGIAKTRIDGRKQKRTVNRTFSEMFKLEE